MANYILGISGDCADCAVDDPCDTDGPVDAQIDDDVDADDWFIYKDVRLHDLNHTADPQIFIVIFQNVTTSGIFKAIAVRSSGVGILSGPSFALPTFGEVIPVRTSHTGNSFSVVRAVSPTSQIVNFSVNPTTLVITQLSGLLSFTTGFRANDACFARDDEIGLVEATDTGADLRYDYWTIDITGGGTGISENTRIFETVLTTNFPTNPGALFLAKIERIDDDFMIAHKAYNVATVRAHARGLDNTGALALGSTVDYHTVGGADHVVFNETDEENDDGQMITVNDVTVFTPYFLRYVTVGTSSAGKFINVLNSSTVGLSGVDGSEQVQTITISGLNITFGSNVVVATGNFHLIRGINSTKSIHFYQVTATAARAEVLG